VKRRFVRVPVSEFGLGGSITLRNWSGADDIGPSQATLNRLHMIGLPNRCHRTDLEKLVFSANTIRASVRMGIGNENDQVS